MTLEIDYEQYEVLLARLEELTDLVSLETAVSEPERDYGSFLSEMGIDVTETTS